jgi:hypothetical protein
MNTEPQSNRGQVPIELQSPFEFDINGKIVICASATKIEGINEFANHYVSEWLLWHRSGRLDTRMCDIAALIVSVIGCKFLPNYSLDHKIEWIERVFLLDKLRETIPVRISDYSESTFAALRALRPTICQAAEMQSVGECDELLQLALPIERMLVLGGDHRLVVDQNTQLNGYGCRPFPRPEAITFSSSTATSISKYAYDFVEQRRQQFISEAIESGAPSAVAGLAQEVRDGICHQLGIGSNVAEVVITASGTDSFLIAHGLTRLLSDNPIVSLIVGVDESGSGVKLALQERHFADDTALSYTVQKGQPLSAGSNQEHQIDIPVRDKSGDAVPTRVLDSQVRNLVVTNIEAGLLVVVHAMNHSKLGYSGPSKALLVELKQRFGSKVCIVIDACQMRLDREDIVEYLEYQMIVIVTGSKYFTGPPFSGAILIPEQLVHNVQENSAKFDVGFNSYCAKEDLPLRLRPILRGGSKSFNLGSLFRWVAAISEMERYYEIPPIIRVRAVSRFCERVEDILLAVPFIELHYQNSCRNTPSGIALGELSGRRMIFPFFLYYDHDGVRKICSEKQVQQIYTLLNQDCSKHFSYKNAREFRLLAQMCHIGQPVPVIHRSGVSTAVLRINVGARIFSESFSKSTGRIINALIEDEFWQIGVILGKIELLLSAYMNNEIEV